MPSAIGTSTENVPPAVAVVVATVAPSTRIVTVEFANAVPLMVGVALLRVDPLTGALIAGAASTQALLEHVAPVGQLLVERQRTHAAVPVAQ